MFTKKQLKNELKQFKPRTTNWRKIANTGALGTARKQAYNKHGDKLKSRLVTPSDNKVLIWEAHDKRPKKITVVKHRTKPIMADYLHKVTHY